MSNIRNKIQKKAVNAITKAKYNGVIDVAPRVGKCKIGIDIMKKRKSKKYLITAPYNTILEGWEKDFVKWNFTGKATLINIRSLSKVNLDEYHTIICDEIHTLSEAQIEGLQGHQHKIVGLSGSISRETKKQLQEELDLNIVYTYSIEQAIKDGIISDYQIYIYKCRLNKKDAYIESGTKDKKFKTTEYNNYNWLTSKFEYFKKMSYYKAGLHNVKMRFASRRADLLYTSKTKIEAAKWILERIQEKVLVFTARTSVADELGDKSYHSKVKVDTLQQFADNEFSKLAVIEMASMGVTIADLKVGLFHQMKSNEENAIQKVLRMCNWEEGEVAKIHILVYEDTKDEEWVEKAISPFDESKITRFNFEKLKKSYENKQASHKHTVK